MRLPVEGEWRDVWYDMSRSDRGGLVGGPEAMHLSNVDWTTPDNASHHYRGKIPVNVGGLSHFVGITD